MKYEKSLLVLCILAISLIGLVILSSGCTQSTTPQSSQPGVELYSQFGNGSVTPGQNSNPGSNNILSSGIIADSLHITRIRILVRDVKMHGDHDNDDFPGHDVRVGPFLLTIVSDSAKLSAYTTLPSGNYDHIKLEVHQFTPSEVSTFINDTTYGDFVTGERYSIIVDGDVFESGVSHPFTYKTGITLNLNLQLDSDLVITPTTSAKLVLLVDPDVLFRIGFFVADPRDPNNKHLIDDNIRFCFRALRHFL